MTAHVRVGVVATAAFLALLLFGLLAHRPASADPVSAPAPAATATPAPEMPQQPRGGWGGRRERHGPPPGFWGRGGPDDNGGQQQAPAPSDPSTDGATES
jgi:hypothetical protein